MKRFLCALMFAFGAFAAGAAELTVFAAASLSDALGEIAPLYARTTGHALRFNFGASGLLARQIQEGAPADVFFSADEPRMDRLEKAGLLLPGTRRTLLANTLVVVVATDGNVSIGLLQDLAGAGVRRIAIGEPATVPVGTYARQYLQKMNLWQPLLDKLVPLDNVRATLAVVESGNADAGFVYRTDALISKKVRIAVEVPLADGPKITYPGAVIKSTQQPAAARALVEYLASPAAQAVFAKYGFLPPR